MLLKVGDLARRTGLTVRTLHHYDSIGLLRPSGRSDGGYRLYDATDIARLHGIQALRGLGLPLDEIGRLLAEGADSLPAIVSRQLQALQLQIEQAGALRDRLELVQSKFAGGDQPGLDDWLDTLQLMTTTSKHFNAAEMKLIFGNWAQVEAACLSLAAEIRVAMDDGLSAHTPAVQRLAQRWMGLMHGWMQGDFDILMRWGRMYRNEPDLQVRSGLDLAVVDFIEQAVQLRLATLRRYVDESEMYRLGSVPEADWLALTQAVQAAMDAGVAPDSPPAEALARQWQALTSRLTRGDTALRDKLQRAHDNEPLLREGALLPPGPRAFLVRARAAFPDAGA